MICFAVLSVNGFGPPYYGRTSLTFDEALLCHRASVFEENSVNFLRRTNFRLAPGFRALWAFRGKLAAAKAGPQILPGLGDKDFEALLMTPDVNAPDPSFVEVHVFGFLHHTAISKIQFWPPRDKKDKVFRTRIREICEDRKIEVKE